MPSYLSVGLYFISAIGVVLWALVQFFSRRIVSSLDRNSFQLEKHSEMMNTLTIKLDKLSDHHAYTTSAQNTEIGSVKSKLSDHDNEISSLRVDRHAHGNFLAKYEIKIALAEKREEKLELAVASLEKELSFVGERMHDIINEIVSLHGIAVMKEWPLPETPNIRSRSRSSN